MAEGVRIKHNTERGVDFVVPLLDVALSAPLFCHQCEREYSTKHMHLRLDGEGAVIVSREVWEETLQGVGGVGFTEMNVVTNPPAQGMDMVDLRHNKHRNPNKFKPLKITRGRRNRSR